MGDFRASLQEICNDLPGSVAATLMSVDGLPVETHEVKGIELANQELDLASLFVEYSTVLGQVQRTGDVFAAGTLEELSIRSANLVTLIRPVTSEYFVAVAMLPGGNTGKGRYLLRVHAPKMLEDLA